MKIIYAFVMCMVCLSVVSGQTTYGEDAGQTGSQSTFIGFKAGEINTQVNNTFLGHSSGKLNTTGNRNTFLGAFPGANNTTGQRNVFAGNAAGFLNTTGSYNTYLGNDAGRRNITGGFNLCIGHASGFENLESNNTFVGAKAGRVNVVGRDNTFLGYESGKNNLGSGNVFLGFKAGFNEAGDDKLYIDNSSTDNPLIYGDFSTDQIGINTNTVPDDYVMAIKGKVITEEVRVQLFDDWWPDYVFETDYSLLPLDELQNFIKENKHLPDVPSSEQVKEQGGIDVGEMNTILLKKIEELTLYVLELKGEVETLKNK